MKKLFLLSAFAFFGVLQAQTEKGNWVIGGSTNLGFNSVTTTYKYDRRSADGPKISTFNFTPSVAYFVDDNIAVGVDISYASITQKYEYDGGSDEKYTTSTFSLMPTATYYFKSAGKALPYLGAGLGVASSKEDDGYDDYTTTGFAWKAKGGVVILLNQTVGLDLGLSYTNTNGKNKDNDDLKIKTGAVGVTAGISVFLK